MCVFRLRFPPFEAATFCVTVAEVRGIARVIAEEMELMGLEKRDGLVTAGRGVTAIWAEGDAAVEGMVTEGDPV